VVGFAAETHDLASEARRKLRRKRLDLVVANDVTLEGAGFGTDTNVVRLIDVTGRDDTLPMLPKDEVAARILDWIVARRKRSGRSATGTGRAIRGRAARRRSRRELRPSV